MARTLYGDRGIFIRAEVYRALGGYKPWPLMHDFEFSGRMEAAGRCTYIRDPCIYASARRFRSRPARTDCEPSEFELEKMNTMLEASFEWMQTVSVRRGAE